MASVADDSIASVALSEMARIREELLREPEVGALAKRHLSGAATSESNSRKDVSGEIAVSIPESANAYHTPNSSNAPPRITTSKSASAVEMELMVNPSPSQEAFRTLTRASSFHGYPGGDTQPMESQVYRDFTESKAKSANTTPKKAAERTWLHEGNDTYDSLGTEKTPRTCIEGDTDYIDLVNGIPSPGAQSVSSNMNELVTSPGAQFQVGENAIAESVWPKTPAVAGHKRSSSGEILTSATTGRQQPAFSQLFGEVQNAPIYSTTQLFNQTQAPSSPVPDGPRSDPIITRPSPNLHNHFSTSPLAMAMSSPVATMRPSTAVEPRGHYMSMQESQDRRFARFRAEYDLERDLDDEILEVPDEENDPELRRVENERKQRAKSEQTRKEFEKIRAPSRPGSRLASSPRQLPTIDLTTPAIAKKSNPLEFGGSDDGNDKADNDAMEVGQDIEAEEGDDVYDELGQTVLRSQGLDHEENEHAPDGPDDMQVDDDRDEWVEPKNILSKEVRQPEDQDNVKDSNRARPVTQHFAIAGSQPMRLDQNHSLVTHEPIGPSSISSFVPGSQYAGRTSQDQAQLPKMSITPTRAVFSSNHQVQEIVLSSPPLAIASSALPAKRNGQFTCRNEEDTDLDGQQIIPESDLPGLDARQNESSRPPTADREISGESNNLNVFSTAPTHLSGSQLSRQKSIVKASPLKLLASQQSNVASQSPRAAAGVRHFADIAGTQSLSQGESRETDVDVVAFMKDIVTTDDQQFIEAVSSPPQASPQKRRKLGHKNSAETRSSLKKIDASELPLPQSLDCGENEAVAGITESHMHGEDASENTKLQSTNALQESPSKANQMPSATQESVREREKAGAKAVSQLLSTRSAKPQRPAPSRNKTLEGTSRAKNSGKGTGNKRRITAQAKPAKNVPDQDEEMHDDALNDQHEPNDDKVEKVGDTPAGVEESSIVAPNRVFALFKGLFNKFYPATWLSSSADGSTYVVKFDDTDPVSIETQHVRRFHLRVGDQVKIDIAGMTNKTWLVKDFGLGAKKDQERTAGTDIYGRANLQVQAKASRQGLPTNKTVAEGEGELVTVAMSNVYLTHMLWPHFADRTFTPPAGSSSVGSRMMTPSSSAQTQDSETPPSKSRRPAKAVNGRTSHLREESVPSIATPTRFGLFSGMVFALSYGPNAGEKEEVAHLIRRNGGIIVENGFDELFDLPKIDDSAATSPSKKSPGKNGKAQASVAGLQLKEEYQSIGFVALIADRHSRRAKYVQALALGLPTLSGRWITDSLDASKNEKLSIADAVPLPWAKYLLPAGESTYLSGAVRSRTMQPYSVKDAKLSDTINSRDLLLTGDGVLIVASKKAKANWERSKTYAFLTLALGARRVKRVSDLPEAKMLISEEPEIWRWIYVEGSITEAGAAIFNKAAGGGKKRKRADEILKSDASKISAGNGVVKIVNDEFVVQSLILGALVD